jgi:hypothetical protein
VIAALIVVAGVAAVCWLRWSRARWLDDPPPKFGKWWAP